MVSRIIAFLNGGNSTEPLKQLTDSPYKKRRAFEEIANNIKELISKGYLKPGDRLPPETEIARQFDVGRNTIREALRILELSGFVKIQMGGKGGPLIIDTSIVLLVEQNAGESLRIADWGYVIENGSVVVSGTSELLVHNEKVRQAYLGT